MADAASFDFIFEPTEQIDWEQLLQGDLLHRTPALADAIGQAHSYYATASDYSHFLVLTQSCDLVRRKGGTCKSRYITICAVRPLSLAVERELDRYTNPLAGCPVPVGNTENSVLARQYLERVLNNTVDGIFFIPRGSAETVEDHLCAFLPLSVALRVEHYETCLGAKVGQAKEIFAAKVGSLASNLYARIATPDLHERNDRKAVEDYKRIFLEELGYSSVVWLTSYQRSELETRISEALKSSGQEKLTREESLELIKGLPREADAIADRVVRVLTENKLLDDDPEIQRKARNYLKNDRAYQRLTKR
jgi:hypothetical protein